MKICIVIQSDSFRKSAGMRIRYNRIRDCLADPDVTLEAATCEELVGKEKLDHDVYIFCKTFDIVALLLARKARAAGKVVGQDVFDDYFSQTDDPRLERFREWMRDMAPVTQFAICSTHRIAEVLREYMPDIPITPIEDPIVGYDPLLVGALSDAKAKRARETGNLQIVWFGIGDNPFFPVGLNDLVACEPELARIERLGFKVRLRIVTNRRPFENGGAEMLRRLSMPFELIEWNEKAEREALVGAAVAIIPVNGQAFSRAKSMNRAVSGLNAGCQVLNLGYPLYTRLSDFIYRSADDLAADIATGSCRLRSARVSALTARLSKLANPYDIAACFVREARFAVAAAANHRRPLPRVCLIHGRESTISVHKMAMALGGISAATIFCKAQWNFRVRFDLVGSALAMRVTPEFAKRFGLPVQASKPPVRILDFDFVEVDLAALNVEPLAIHLPEDAKPLQDLSLYEDVMRFAQDCCSKAFAPADVLFSDNSPIRRRPRRVPDATVGERNLAGQDLSLASARTIVAIRSAGQRSYERIRRLWHGLGSHGPERLVSRTERQLRHTIALVEDSALFDRQWYLEKYRDVAASGIDPIRHYLGCGWREGRDPGPGFSTTAYLRANADVAEEGMNPLLHFLEFGLAEGRGAPEHGQPRRAKPLKDFGPAAPFVGFLLEPEPMVRWKSTGQLNHEDGRALVAGDQVIGYLPDQRGRQSFDAMLARLARISGAETGTADIVAAKDWQHATLLDAWHAGGGLLRTRWRCADGDGPFVVRALQVLDGALRLVSEYLVGNELDPVDTKLLNALFPILFVFASPDGAILGWQLLAFPSLCRGGLHYPELIASRPADGEASAPAVDLFGVDGALAERLLAICDNTSRPLLSEILVDLRNADGAHPLFQPDFRSWLRNVARISLQAADGPGSTGAKRYLAQAVRLKSDRSRSNGLGGLILGSDFVPTIAALTARSTGEAGGVEQAIVPFVVAGADPSEPSTLVSPPPNAKFTELPGYIPAFPRIELDAAGSAEAGDVQFFAIRTPRRQALDDADLLVPVSAPGLELPAQSAAMSWLLWPDTWREEELLQALEAVALQTNAGPFTVIFVGSPPGAVEALAGRLFDDRVHSAASLDEAFARLDTPFVAYLGSGVILHDQRTAAMLATTVEQSNAASASALVVAVEKRGKGWLIAPADAGKINTRRGAERPKVLEAADSLLLWRASWPAALPPRDLWVTRTETLLGWRSNSAIVDGHHICSALVTASYCGPRSSAQAPLTPPAAEGLQTELIVG